MSHIVVVGDRSRIVDAEGIECIGERYLSRLERFHGILEGDLSYWDCGFMLATCDIVYALVSQIQPRLIVLTHPV